MDLEDAIEMPDESEGTRLNRELSELMQELRVAQNGILIVVGFLLVIPFTQRFNIVTNFEKIVYYLSFLTAGAAAVVIVAPVSYHRMVFRRRDKQALVTRGNMMAMLGLGLLAIAILGVLVLVTDFLFNMFVVAVVGVLYVVIVLTLWYLLPLQSRRRASKAQTPIRDDREAPEASTRPREHRAHS